MFISFSGGLVPRGWSVFFVWFSRLPVMDLVFVSRITSPVANEVMTQIVHAQLGVQLVTSGKLGR